VDENLAGNLTRAAQRQPERSAIKLDDVVVPYAGLDVATALMAGFLRERGVGPGDRVATMLPNVPYVPVAYYGALRLGAIVVPMNPLLRAREVAFHLEDSGAKLLLAWHGMAEEAGAGAERAGAELFAVEPGGFEAAVGSAPRVDEVAPRAGDDTAVVLYTSGTTGTPKGAELTHANLGRNAEVSAAMFSLGPEDVVLGALPLFHSFGQTCAMNVAVWGGACLTLIPRFDPGRALEIIERDRVTIFEGVPTMYGAMLNHSERDRFDVSSLRVCVSGGAALPLEVMRGFEEAFGCTVLEGYGLSETSPVASFNRAERRKPGTIGIPIEGVEMRVVDERGDEVPTGEVGEIVIRGHNVMKGYWRRPDATREAFFPGGWFRSGDLARVDEDGFFTIVDRRKDLIIRGGYNVYPREVEEVLYEHPAVMECAVVGVPHPELGEEVAAVVVLKEGAAADADALREHVRAQVAPYKYPRRVWVVDALPKTATGKILKREIRVPEPVAEA
jgi:long-chain acyl-CoA synthetase